MQKIVDELIKHSIKGVDVYRWKSATWLIFTDEMRWVVELTDEGTLWYNYRFFKDTFRYVSITVGEEMDKYIMRWANDYFFKDCTYCSIAYSPDKDRGETEKVLDYGIKKTVERGKNHGDEFEWHTRAVMNQGVKEISNSMNLEPKQEFIEEMINQGVKEVNQSDSIHRQMRAENEMGKMIKEVKPNSVTVKTEDIPMFYYEPNCTANFTILTDIIEKGVKKVKPNVVFHGIGKESMSFVPCNGNTTDINIIVNNGIKNIYPDQNSGEYDWSDEFEAGKVIYGGVKL